MTDPAEKRHAIEFVEGARPGTPGVKLGLSSVDELALREFVGGEPKAWDVLIKQVSHWAHSLYERDDRDDARMRMLARMIASHRAKALMLEAKRDEALVVRDFQATAMLDKVLDGTMKRLLALLEEHRRACGAGQRSVSVTAVAVNRVDTVNVVAGRTE